MRKESGQNMKGLLKRHKNQIELTTKNFTREDVPFWRFQARRGFTAFELTIANAIQRKLNGEEGW